MGPSPKGVSCLRKGGGVNSTRERPGQVRLRTVLGTDDTANQTREGQVTSKELSVEEGIVPQENSYCYFV